MRWRGKGTTNICVGSTINFKHPGVINECRRFQQLSLIMSTLFKPLKVGEAELAHRIAMAPLTRFRSDDDWLPLLPMVKGTRARISVSPYDAR
jgi:hypothetical protein